MPKLHKKAHRSPFPFLSLPPEIRNQIYAYLFRSCTEQPISIIRPKKNFLDRHLLSALKPGQHSPRATILQTCHQAHGEAFKYLYEDAHFGLFLRPPALRGSRAESEEKLYAEVKVFLTTHRSKTRFIQRLDIGSSDLATSSLLASTPASILSKISKAITPRHHPSKRNLPMDSRLLLASLLKLLAGDLWNVRSITFHDDIDAPVRCGGRTFLMLLRDIFPRLQELRVLKTRMAQRQEDTENSRVEIVCYRWDQDAELARLVRDGVA